jgi:CarD family transcriptional regulator
LLLIFHAFCDIHIFNDRQLDALPLDGRRPIGVAFESVSAISVNNCSQPLFVIVGGATVRGTIGGRIESWRRMAMAAHKKTTKKTAARGSKAQKRTAKTAAKSAKNSAARKSKTTKTLTKAEKAALAAKQKTAKAKASAKSAARSEAASKPAVAAKQIAAASKSSRESVKHKDEVLAKSASGAQAVKNPPAATHPKENEALSGAKAKTEAKTPALIKTQPVAKSNPSAPKTVANAQVKPAAVGVARHSPPAAPAAIVPLQGAAKPTAPAARPAASDGAPAQRAEESLAQKTAKPAAAPRHGFKAHEFVVYPAHGVGQIVAIEEQEVAGFKLELFVITFVKDKMMLRVPVGKAAGVGMRKLSDPDLVKRALDTLLGRARIKRTMWSRRAQEYEAKINSGDLIAIAEVVRDLYRSEAQPEQSYSERQLYEAALDRMAREVAVVQKLGEADALKAIEGQLQKGQRRGKTDAATPAGEGGDTDVEEAA